MLVYIVKHLYDDDGGFGDAIWNEETVAVFSSEELAKRFVEERFEIHETTIYDHPYADLTFGTFSIKPMEVFESLEAISSIKCGSYDHCKEQYDWFIRRNKES